MQVRKRDFTFRQLSSFVAAARTGSFARAADKLSISQPAISDHIGALETNLGYALFERRRGTTPRLTTQGVEMLHRAESLLRTSQAMRGNERHNGTETRRVRIRLSVGARLREVCLKPLLPRFYADHPDIEVELVPMLALRNVATAMERGEIDLLFHTVGHFPETLPNVRLIRNVDLAVVAFPPIAQRIAAGELAIDDVTFVLPQDSAHSEPWLERQLIGAGIHPRRPIRYVDFPDVVQAMVESGLGASILMREQVQEALDAGRLSLLDVELAAMKRIVSRAPSAPLVTELLERKLIRAVRENTPA